MSIQLNSGTTSKSLRVLIRDAAGAPKTGMLFSDSGLTWYWILEGDSSATVVAMVTATVGTWVTNGFVEVDATNLPGVYEIGIPNAALLNVGELSMYLHGAADMSEVTVRVNVASPFATAEQVSSIGAGSSSGFNFSVSADNTAGAIIDGVPFIGSQTGTFTNTEANVLTFHQIDDVSDAFDLVYRIATGSINQLTAIVVDAYLNGSNDSCDIQLYDHVGSDWETVAVLDGVNSASLTEIILSPLGKHTGAVGSPEAGNGYIRFVCSAQTGPTLFIARCIGTAQASESTMGYEGGFVYVDEVSGKSSGVVQGEDGIFANQCDDFDNAQTIADNLGSGLLSIAHSNSITLTSAVEGYSLFGNGSEISLGGQEIGGTLFRQFSNVMGSSLTTSAVVFWQDCAFGNAAIPPSVMQHCGLSSTLTVGAAGDYTLVDCYSKVAGTSSPIVDFAAVGATTFEARRWSGGITLNNLAAGDVVTLEGQFGTITLNGADATVEIRGLYKSIVNNLTGSPTVNVALPNANTTHIESVDATDQLDAHSGDSWTDTEKKQFRDRIGIDGVSEVPSTGVPTLATSAKQDITHNRLGAWLGTGIDTVLGAMKALMSKNASAPTAIGGTFDPGSHSLEALRERGDISWITSVAVTPGWTTLELQQLRHRLGVDGSAVAPVTNQPNLTVDVLTIEGVDATDAINTEVDVALLDYAGAKPSDVMAARDAVISAISGQNDLSSAEVLAAVSSAITSAGLETAVTAAGAHSATLVAIGALENLNAVQIRTIADAALLNYDAATGPELASARLSIETLINALENLSATQAEAAAIDAIAAFDLSTAAQLAAARASIESDISNLNGASPAEVLIQVTDALNSYDAATGPELADALADILSSISALTGASPTEVLEQVATGLATYGTAKTTDVVAARNVITAGIGDLENLSVGEVETALLAKLADYQVAKISTIDATELAILNSISALNPATSADVLTQSTAALVAYAVAKKADIQSEVTLALQTYTVATAANVSASTVTLQDDIANLTIATPGDVLIQVTTALNDYETATEQDVTDARDAIQADIAEYLPGTVTVSVVGSPQAGSTVMLKRGSPETLIFNFTETITMSTVFLGIRDDSGRSLLKIAGTINNDLKCTFQISAKQALELIDGSHHLDVFEIDGYDEETQAYSNAKNIATAPVEVIPLYLRLEPV